MPRRIGEKTGQKKFTVGVNHQKVLEISWNLVKFQILVKFRWCFRCIQAYNNEIYQQTSHQPTPTIREATCARGLSVSRSASPTLGNEHHPSDSHAHMHQILCTTSSPSKRIVFQNDSKYRVEYMFHSPTSKKPSQKSRRRGRTVKMLVKVPYRDQPS